MIPPDRYVQPRPKVRVPDSIRAKDEKRGRQRRALVKYFRQRGYERHGGTWESPETRFEKLDAAARKGR